MDCTNLERYIQRFTIYGAYKTTMKSISINNILLQLKLMFWGALVFSTLNSALFTVNGVNIGDLLLIIGTILFWRDPSVKFVINKVLLSNLFAVFIIIISIYFIIGCLNHRDILSALRDARSLIYFAVGFIFSYKKKWEKLDNYYYLVLWSFMADIVMNIYIPRDPDISSFKNYYYLSGIPLIIAIPWVYKKTLLTFIGIFMALVMSVNSGYRTVSVITVTTIFIAWIVTSYNNYKYHHKLKALFPIAVGGVLIFLIYFNISIIIEAISAYVLNINQKLFNMLIYKNTLLFAGESDSDTLRLSYITHIFKYWYRYIFPYGLGYSTTIDNIKSFKDEFNFGGNTLDNTYFWMVYHYGLIMAFYLFTYFILKIKRIFFAKQKSNIHLVIIIIFIPFMISNYTFSFLSVPFHSFFTAILLGIMFRLTSYKKTVNGSKLLCN